jgi:spore coat polysaccharide biosynthesis protein SpsF
MILKNGELPILPTSGKRNPIDMKIGFFITARLKSSRLKRKILLDLNAKSVLDRIIERCKAVQGIDGVVLCTSTNPEDSELYENALINKIQFFPGSEDDVLDRLLSAAEYYGYGGFMSITADNPLFSIKLSQLTVDFYKKERFDFAFTKGLPIGCNVNFLSVNALKMANYMKQESDTEMWGPFVNRRDFFNIGEIIVENSPVDSDKRLTCDYPEDYQLFREIYNRFESNHIPRLPEVFKILTEMPSLWNINANRQQRQVPEGVLSKINQQFNSRKQAGLTYAKEHFIKLKPGYKAIKVKV